MAASASPRSWRGYCSALHARGRAPEASLSRFRGRYRLAASFRSAAFSHLAPDTQAGYTSLMRLALAYGALESLCSALGRPVGREPLRSVEISTMLRDRRSSRISALMLATAESPLVTRIQALLEDPDLDDVMPAASFYRHKFLHGALTATGAGTGRSAWERGIVNALADLLLTTADERFSDHVVALQSEAAN